MDKLFTFSKWFVLFCALLVVANLARQYVGDRVISEEAQVAGENIYSFEWDNGVSGAHLLKSEGKVVETKVLHRSASDAQVRISGNQIISALDGQGKMLSEPPINSKFSAVLSFFKENKHWILSKVEVE